MCRTCGTTGTRTEPVSQIAKSTRPRAFCFKEGEKTVKLIKKILDHIGRTIAFSLSVSLVLVLMLAPLLFAGHRAHEEEQLQTLVLSLIPVDQLKMNVQDPMLQELIGSGTGKELLEMYVGDLFSNLDGDSEILDQQSLGELTDKNMGELTGILERMTEENGGDLGNMEEMAQELVDRYAGELLQSAPSLEISMPELPERFSADALSQTCQGALRYAKSLWILDGEQLEGLLNRNFMQTDMTTLVAQIMLLLDDYRGLKLLGFVAAVLGLLILFFRMGNGFRGFSWLGSCCLIGGGMSVGIGIVLKSQLGMMAVYGGDPTQTDLPSRALGWYMEGGGVILGLGVLLLLLAALGNWALYMMKKRRQENR